MTSQPKARSGCAPDRSGPRVWTDAIACARRLLDADPELTWPALWSMLVRADVVSGDQEDACRSALRRATANGELPRIRPAKRGSRAGSTWSAARRFAADNYQKESARPAVDGPTIYELFIEREAECIALLSSLAGVVTVRLTPRSLAILAAQGYGAHMVHRAVRELERAGLAEVRWSVIGCDRVPCVKAAA